MLSSTLRVYIIDDDDAVRDSLRLLLDLHGFEAVEFASAEAFLGAYRPEWAGIVLVDLRMPGMSGLQFQTTLKERNIPLPVIVITAHGDTSAARMSFKSGAIDFLEKPVDSQQLLAALREGMNREAERLRRAAATAAVSRQLSKLTNRERQVLDLVVAGKHNREIATELNISARTVEVHKARLLAKMGVERVPDLMRVLLSSST